MRISLKFLIPIVLGTSFFINAHTLEEEGKLLDKKARNEEATLGADTPWWEADSNWLPIISRKGDSYKVAILKPSVMFWEGDYADNPPQRNLALRGCCSLDFFSLPGLVHELLIVDLNKDGINEVLVKSGNMKNRSWHLFSIDESRIIPRLSSLNKVDVYTEDKVIEIKGDKLRTFSRLYDPNVGYLKKDGLYMHKLVERKLNEVFKFQGNKEDIYGHSN